MEKSTIPFEVKQLKAMKDGGTLIFDHPIQRRGNQWDDYSKGLLIHSMLSGYIVPPVYLIKEFTGDYDDDEYEIAGKLFSELPDEIQENIKRYRFILYNLENCTDDEIEECFIRLNNSVTLTKSQKSKAKLGMDLARYVDRILAKKFFTDICHFTPAQYRRAADQCVLIQSMMLLDMRYEGFELKSISENHILEYAESLHGNYSVEQQNRVEEAIDYLEKVFDKKEKFMKKINIPMFIYMADEAIVRDIDSKDFYEWFRKFADSYTPDCEYSNFCSTGSIKKEKVLGRIEVMEESFNAMDFNALPFC